MPYYKKIAALLLAALMLLPLTGCGGDTPAKRREANEIVIGVAQDMNDSLDPHYTVGAGTKEFLFNIFEGLVKPSPAGELLPAVAESYIISSDYRTFTFHLREDVKFHNGDTVTMEDVLFSIERRHESGLTPSLDNVVSMDTDGNTLTITLETADSEFLPNMTFAIIPKDYEYQANDPIGTGPFCLTSRTPQQEIVLTRFANYWGEPAKINRVTYKIIENADTLVMSLRSGAIDLCAHLTSTQVEQLTDFDILEGTMNLVQAVYLNHAVEPLNNELVRQAMCHALNRTEIFNIIADGHGTAVGSSMYPAFEKYFLPELADLYPYDPDRAVELLTRAGYPDGFPLRITVPSNYQPHIDTAQIVAEQFRAVGIDVTIDLVEWAAWLSDVYTARDFEATVVGLDATTMSARAMLERYTTGHGKNFINHSNADYDAAFADMLAATNDDEQTDAYLQMETILAETAANVYIQDLCDLVAIRKDLGGYRFYPIYVMDVSTLYYK